VRQLRRNKTPLAITSKDQKQARRVLEHIIGVINDRSGDNSGPKPVITVIADEVGALNASNRALLEHIVARGRSERVMVLISSWQPTGGDGGTARRRRGGAR
jgi:hypothetical protein